MTQKNHYDPWGVAIEQEVVADTSKLPRFELRDRFTYNGKELQGDLVIFAYGFRWYDPSIAKFISVDPLAEKFPELTVYQYTSNNPIVNIDLDGLEGINTNLVAPWHQKQRQAPQSELVTLDVKQETSLGLQGGVEQQIGGFKVGLFLNLASIKLSNFSTNLVSDNKSPQNKINNAYEVEHEFSASLGLLGASVKYTHGENQEGTKTSEYEYSVNVGTMEYQTKNTTETDKSGQKTSSNKVYTKYGATGTRLAAGLSVSAAAELNVPMTTSATVNYSSLDATQVNINKKYIKNDK